MRRLTFLRRLFAVLVVLLTVGGSTLPATAMSEEEEEHGREEASSVLKVTAPRGGPPATPIVARGTTALPRVVLRAPAPLRPSLPLPRPPIPRLLI